MKILADMGISLRTVENLRKAKYDVVHLADQGLFKLSDEKILEKARKEQRVVVTFDLDFADLMAVSNESIPSTIILRLQDQRPKAVTPKLLAVLKKESELVAAGAIIVVENHRYRVRRLPIGGD